MDNATAVKIELFKLHMEYLKNNQPEKYERLIGSMEELYKYFGEITASKEEFHAEII